MPLTKHLKSDYSLKDKEKKLLLKSYEKGFEIPIFEPGFWQIYQGIIQLSRIDTNGDEIILGWLSTNNYFGTLVTNQTNYRAEALSNTYLTWHPLRELTKSPDLTRILITQLSQHLIKVQQLLNINKLRRVEKRLWQLLLILKEEIGEPVINGTRLRIRFSHKNLANIIHSSRPTITKALINFQKKELIYIDQTHHIIIR